MNMFVAFRGQYCLLYCGLLGKQYQLNYLKCYIFYPDQQLIFVVLSCGPQIN